MANRWRRFLPRRKPSMVVLDDGMRLSTIRSVDDADAFAGTVKAMPRREERSDEAERLRTQLLAQTPTAVQAQMQMDSHKHGYHNREKRLYELIDFNDTFVSFVLATRHADLPGLADRLKKDMVDFCGRLDVPMFSDEQYDAIVRGLGREIAVYRTAKYNGFGVRMTSRTEDAFGIDMIITQPDTGKVLNIDCKTPAAFRHRLEDLVHHDRITEADLLRGDAQGFLTTVHKRGSESVPVTLFCILPDRLGEISDFTFDEPDRLKVMLDAMFQSV